MHMRKLLLAVLAMLFFTGQLLAQKNITGKVTDDKGDPIPNASVIVKGTNTGTVTKLDGTYSLTVPAEARILVFSSVDMSPLEVIIGSETTINPSLRPVESILAEVIMVGYGTQQKKEFTGSASKVDVKEFSNLMTPSVDKQLAGRATGVQVTNSGGLVNSPAVIRIRGVNSLTQGNSPLIVVDGVPMLNGNLASATNSNELADINPADIESMEVLKDGSATAIYGSRAAAGVILITTKKGTKGKTKVSYDGFVGFSSALKKFSVLNADQFVVIANEKLTNAGMPLRAGVNTSAESFETDWQSDVMIDNAPINNHTLSIQGGGEKTSYYFSMNYSDQKGIIISNFNKSYRLRMNIDYEANRFLKIGNNISVSRQEDGDQNNGSNALGGAIAASIRQLPNVSPYSSTHFSGYNINYPNTSSMQPGANSQTIDDNFSNVAFTLRNNKSRSDRYHILNNTFLELSPFKGFKFRSQLGVDMLSDYSYQGLSPLHGDGYGTPTGGTNGSMFNANQNFLRLVFSNFFNYNISIKKHNIYLTAGHEVQKTTTKTHSSSGTNISDIFFIKENYISNTATIQSIGGSYGIVAFESFFARLNYDFRNKYFLQATIRKDGQSSLAPDKKYGTFPGFSVGWRPSEEAFWKNSPLLDKWLSEAKIKASYGKVGNTIGGFPYLSTFGSAPYGNVSGIAPNAVGNAALQWETSTKYDVGIELGILRSRFNVTADWFLNDVDNLAFAVPTPPSAGVPGNSITQNIATLQNRGIELAVGGTIVQTKGFTWDLNVNYTFVKNKITSLYELGGAPVQFVENGVYNRIIVGQPMNVIYGYNYAGVNSANGNPMFVKADGSLVQLNLTSSLGSVGSYFAATKDVAALGTLSSLTATDKTILGQGIPTYFGAIINSFSYKGLNLEIMLRYSGGNKIMNVTRQEALFNMKFQNNGTEILNRWTTAGQITDVPKLYYGQDNNINRNSEANSRYVEDGNFWRLQNIVLSYQLPAKGLNWSNGILRSAKVFVQGQNLHVWTKYKGADPENISTAGIDAAVSPQVRTISFGLSLGL